MAELKTPALVKTGPSMGEEADLFPATLPSWVVRSLGWFLALLFLAAFAGSFLIRVPETIPCPFVLDPLQGKILAKLSLPEEALAEVRPGQPVKLLFNAFPYQRYGARGGNIVSVSPTVAGTPEGQVFYATAQLADQSITVGGISHPLRPGMRGEARIIVGRRTLIEYVFEPIRRLRESLGG